MSFLLKCVQSNALLSISSTVAMQDLARSFVTRVRISGAKRADIEKRLGFPDKPKYPAHPFFRFSEELRPTLKPTGDGRKASDIVVELGALWRETDEEKKAIYRQAYEKDLTKYKKEMEAYTSKITDKQTEELKNELKSELDELRRKRDVKSRREASKELGKPKRPGSACFLFGQHLRGKSSAKLTTADVAAKWNSLHVAEKKSYQDKAARLNEKYWQDLQKWELEMLKAGRTDLVRVNQLPKDAKKKKGAVAKAASKSEAKPASKSEPKKPKKSE